MTFEALLLQLSVVQLQLKFWIWLGSWIWSRPPDYKKNQIRKNNESSYFPDRQMECFSYLDSLATDVFMLIQDNVSELCLDLDFLPFWLLNWSISSVSMVSIQVAVYDFKFFKKQMLLKVTDIDKTFPFMCNLCCIEHGKWCPYLYHVHTCICMYSCNIQLGLVTNLV